MTHGLTHPHAATAELAAQLRDSLARLEQSLAGYTEAELSAPGPEGWSVKDHLAHLAAWERQQVSVLQGRSPAAALGMEPAFYDSASEAALNAWLHARDRHRPLAWVWAEVRAARAAMLQALAAIDDDRLHAPARPGAEWSLLEAIVSNTSGHSEEHWPWLARLLPR